MNRPAVFLDDGGVMNDNARRGLQYPRLAGQYLASHLGGTAEAWAVANTQVIEPLFQGYDVHFRAQPAASWAAYWAFYEERWLGGMCAAVGIAAPVAEAERRRLGRACNVYVTRRVHATFAGVVGAIRQLHRAGYQLSTASGETSWELDGYLTGMRVRTCFGALYGPDQVDTAKASPLYYQQVFGHGGVAPSDAVVVDDSERALNWAAEVGAHTVLCGSTPPNDGRHRHIQRLADLPRLLGAIV